MAAPQTPPKRLASPEPATKALAALPVKASPPVPPKPVAKPLPPTISPPPRAEKFESKEEWLLTCGMEVFAHLRPMFPSDQAFLDAVRPGVNKILRREERASSSASRLEWRDEDLIELEMKLAEGAAETAAENYLQGDV